MRFMKLLKSKIDSIAIGKFDGFHLAHQELFKRLSKNGAILIIDRGGKDYLLPREFANRFTRFPIFKYELYKIIEMNGEEFVNKLQTDFPNLQKLIVGYDFSFGKGRKCTVLDLKNISNLKLDIIDEVKIDNTSVHSGKIKDEIINGNIESANLLLGRKFSIIGKHINGQGIGRKELVPTINIESSKFLYPKKGVYLTEAIFNNKKHNSLSFIGIRDSTDGKFAFETYILDEILAFKNFGEIEVKFTKYLRENISFKTLKDLKYQIFEDIKIAKSYL